nr:MAG TPA: hypothetical protein [Caudoviricetes sp.]
MHKWSEQLVQVVVHPDLFTFKFPVLGDFLAQGATTQLNNAYSTKI